MKKLLTACLCATMLLGFVACDSKKNIENPKKEYVSPDDIEKVYSSPNDYKGKYIKLTGQSFHSVHHTNEVYDFLMWQDFINDCNNTIIYTDNDPKLNDHDYIFVEGEILGEKTGKNAFGSELSLLMIQAETIKHGDYKTIIAPTLKEIVLDDVFFSQNDVTTSISKVEFAENETRVYFKIANNSDTKFVFPPANIDLIQESEKYDVESNFQADYPKLKKNIQSRTTEEGVLVYPKIQQTDFKIVASGLSNNYDFEFNITTK